MLDAKEFVKSQAKKWRKFKCPYCGYYLGYNGILVIIGQMKCRNCDKLINLNKIKKIHAKFKEKRHINEKPKFDEKIIASVKHKDRPSKRVSEVEMPKRKPKIPKFIRARVTDKGPSLAPPLEIPILMKLN